jgi:hypothetical protein
MKQTVRTFNATRFSRQWTNWIAGSFEQHEIRLFATPRTYLRTQVNDFKCGVLNLQDTRAADSRLDHASSAVGSLKRRRELVQVDATPENSTDTGYVTFSDTHVRVSLPVATPGLEECVSKEMHAQLAKILLEYKPKRFKMCLELTEDSRCDFTIDREVAAKLPLLAPLLEAPALPPRKAAKRNGSASIHDLDFNVEASQGAMKVPFNAPASGCGLACLLLLLVGAADDWDLFLPRPWGQLFGTQTVWVRPDVLDLMPAVAACMKSAHCPTT